MPWKALVEQEWRSPRDKPNMFGDDIEPAYIFYPVLGISIHKTAGVCWNMMFQYTAVVLSYYLGLVSEYGRQQKATETGTNKQYNLGRLIISIRLPFCSGSLGVVLQQPLQ